MQISGEEHSSRMNKCRRLGAEVRRRVIGIDEIDNLDLFRNLSFDSEWNGKLLERF